MRISYAPKGVLKEIVSRFSLHQTGPEKSNTHNILRLLADKLYLFQTDQTYRPNAPIPSCFAVTGFNSLAVETWVLENISISILFIPTSLRARKSTSCKMYHCAWKAFLAWWRRPDPRESLVFWPFISLVLTTVWPWVPSEDKSLPFILFQRPGWIRQLISSAYGLKKKVPPLPFQGPFHQSCWLLLGFSTSSICIPDM